MTNFSVLLRLESGQHIAVTLAAFSSTEVRQAAKRMFPGCMVVYVSELRTGGMLH